MPERASFAVSAEALSHAGFDPADSAGLFVGVAEFEDERFAPVQFAVDDAVDLAHLFTVELGLVQPENVVLALAGEPQKGESRARMAKLSELGARQTTARLRDVYRFVQELRARAGQRGLFLFSISTHGVSDDKSHYLMTSDSDHGVKDEVSIRYSRLGDLIASAAPPRKLVLLDACRERLTRDLKGDDGTPMSESFADAIAQTSGLAVLSAATRGGFAYSDGKSNGVFTAAVLEGLRGAAPADERGWITVSTLKDYVHSQVVRWTRLHHPDRVAKTLGISAQLDIETASMPLAINPEVERARKREEEERARRAAEAAAARQLEQEALAQRLETYRNRREAALSLLRMNLGAILKGSHYDQIEELLPEREGGEGAEKLLEEIETLDGTARSQRALKQYLVDSGSARLHTSLRPVNAPQPKATPASTASAASKPVPVAEPPVRKAKAEGTASVRRLLNVLATIVLIPGLIGVGVLAYLWAKSRPVVSTPAKESVPKAAAPASSEPVPGTAQEGPLGMQFRFVPAGTYTLGSPKGEDGRFDNETLHEVQLTRGFWLGETEVTQAQWKQLVPLNPSYFESCGDECPVENVSWFEAVVFANKVSDRAGLAPCYDLSSCKGTPGTADYSCGAVPFAGLDCPGYRLPTEAEWEVAARAGTRTAIYSGKLTLRGQNNGPELDPIAWYGGNSGVVYTGGFDCSGWPEKQFASKFCGTHPVGTKLANRWDFRDLLGNVWEWTGDWYAAYPSARVPDPTGPAVGSLRVFRGGSWRDFARGVRAAARDARPPESRFDFLGFRLARGQPLRQ